MIDSRGCTVSTRYDVEYSNIVDSVEGGNHIRISLRNVKHPLDIIWKLLHEYGHFLSGKRKPTDSMIQREELAWNFADKLLNDYPDLHFQEESYFKCKEECLASYRNFMKTN